MQRNPLVLLSNARTSAALLGQVFSSISRKGWTCFWQAGKASLQSNRRAGRCPFEFLSSHTSPGFSEQDQSTQDDIIYSHMISFVCIYALCYCCKIWLVIQFDPSLYEVQMLMQYREENTLFFIFSFLWIRLFQMVFVNKEIKCICILATLNVISALFFVVVVAVVFSTNADVFLVTYCHPLEGSKQRILDSNKFEDNPLSGRTPFCYGIANYCFLLFTKICCENFS